ncbi:hypothetical protein ONZ43_g1757 [Nemania bipapillata]|uniref:Uncharacterized protein n=1 Tax=Nemania bipapillata TaxID=110536 RepID=A0ACC2J361_9PEZI|nr:hypothetical protein ONZ43_g1757 [Nemania bipapillata]
MFKVRELPIEVEPVGPSAGTLTAATGLYRLAASTTPPDGAGRLVDSLVERVIENWQRCHAELSMVDYALMQAADPLYNADSLEISALSQAHFPMRTESRHVMHDYGYPSALEKVPLLMDRRDTMPEFSKWLPLVPGVLAARFMEYLQALAPRPMSEMSEDLLEFSALAILRQVGYSPSWIRTIGR